MKAEVSPGNALSDQRNANHPDANVLTAFAERALPQLEREFVLQHLARCDDCRDIVVLALPEAELMQTAFMPSPKGWFAWPALRWGFVTAGVVAIAALGLVQYQRREQMAMFDKQSRNEAVAVSLQPTAPTGTASPAASRDKSFLDSTAPAGRSSREPRARGETAGNESKVIAGTPSYSRADQSSVSTQPSGSTSGANALRAGGSGGSALALSQPALPRPNARAEWGGASAARPGSEIASNRKDDTPRAADTRAELDMEASNRAASTDEDASGSRSALSKAKPPVPASPDANQPTTDPIRQLRVRAAAGQMGGRVVDPSGAVVAKARITVTPSNGEPTNAVTDDQGVWLIAGLPSGKYTAQASMPGFKTEALDFNYDARQPSMYSFTLSPGSVSETVEVASAEVALQTESAAVGNVITSQQVQQLPVEGRNATNVAVLVPGVAAQTNARWNITAAGSLQRSVDQGATWHDVDVNASVALVAGSYAKQASADKKSKKDEKSASTPVFRAVAVNGADVWAGGSAGSLYHSLDAGDHWTRVVPFAAGSALTGDVVSLQFPDSQHGTVTTSTSEVWTTGNNGATWQKQ